MTEEVIKKTVALYKKQGELSKTISELTDKEVIGIAYTSKNIYLMSMSTPYAKTEHIDSEEIKIIVLGMLKSKLHDVEQELKNLQC